MTTQLFKAGMAVLMFGGCWRLVGGEGPTAVEYPKDFRTWAVVKTVTFGPESKGWAVNGGLHHYYANEKALAGFLGGKFQDGSVIVDERLETHEKDGIISEGPRRSVAVMTKDAARYRDTGGWGFDYFQANEQVKGAPDQVRSACFACHSKQKERDQVFSEFRK